MAMTVTTRTVHTIYIELTDDVLARVETGDDVEVILASRVGTTAARRLSYADRRHLLDEPAHRR